jgi:hypothetical protein
MTSATPLWAARFPARLRAAGALTCGAPPSRLGHPCDLADSGRR